jgi:hypothetical protein
MVAGDVWDAAWHGRARPTRPVDFFGQVHVGPVPHVFLCIGCLEARIGRRLSPADFTNVPLNGLPDNSARLKDRIGRGGT